MSTLDNNSNDRLGVVVETFLQRWRRGERPNAEEFARSHPDLRDDLRRLIPTLVLLEEVKASEFSSDDSLSEDDATAATAAYPTRLGDYRLLREIGRGGMGVVFEAEQESLGRRVALKVLLAQARLDPKYLQRFQREARAAAKLHHTNIVPVFGVGEDQGLHYFVMQYIAGQGLDHVIAELGQSRRSANEGTDSSAGSRRWLGTHHSELATRRSSRTQAVAEADTVDDSQLGALAGTVAATLCPDDSRYWHNVARVGHQIADALAHAHAHGTLHRDIKPSNLLLDATGNTWITDFGLAKSFDEDNLTQTGDVLGTLRYLAPEALRGKFDVRSDVYALGLTLYELCSLRPARDAVHRDELVRHVASGDVPRLSRARPDVPRDLQTIIHKALDHASDRRYQSAGDLAADLDRFLHDRPIRARRAHVVERLWRTCRRNPVLSGTIAAATVIVLATAAAAFISISVSRDEALEALGEKAAALAQAEQATQLAERHAGDASESLTTARATVRRYLGLLGKDERLKSAGLEPLRVQLLMTAIAFYDGLAAKHADDPDVQCDCAEGYADAGQLLRETGAIQKALPMVEKALGLMEKLHAQFPENRRYTERLAQTLTTQYQVLRRLMRNEESHAAQRRALEIRASLAQQYPEEAGATYAWAKALELAGLAAMSLGREDDAIRDLEASLPLLRRLIEGHSEHKEARNWRRDVAEVCTNLGIVLKRKGATERAERMYLDALSVVQQLLQDDASDRKAQFSLAHIRLSLGNLQTAVSRFAEAERTLTLSIDGFAALGDKRPEAIAFRDYQCFGLGSLGELYHKCHRFADADAAFSRAIAIRRKQVQADPKLADCKAHLVFCLNECGEARYDAGRFAEALAVWEECLVVKTELARLRQGGQDHPLAIANLQLKLAVARGELREWPAAADWASRSVTALSAVEADTVHPLTEEQRRAAATLREQAQDVLARIQARRPPTRRPPEPVF